MKRASQSAPSELTQQLELLCMRALASEYDQINYDLFRDVLLRPALRLSDAKTQLGLWESSPATITLSRSLILQRPWGTVAEVLKHEMAHQFVSQVLGVVEPAHGPCFRRVCEERGIDAQAAGEVPDGRSPAAKGVLSKVARLLALAESGNSHEAEAAMSAAQRLMLKYNLEQADAAAEKGFRFRHLGKPTGRVEESARVLAAIIREFFFVETLWVRVFRPLEGKWGSVLEVCGAEENLELAQYVHGFLTQTAARLWKEHQHKNGIRKNRDRRRYVAGVMAGFYTKLQRERGKNQAEGLVWLGDAKLEGFFKRRYPKTRSVSYGTSGGSSAYTEGRKAGERIVLHRGMTSGPSGSTRLLGH